MTLPRTDSDQGRAELARHWASALRATAYVPTSRHEIESLLRGLLDSLFDALTVDEFSPDQGRTVGQQLVTACFIGEQSLSCTLEVLGRGLPVDPELRHVDGLAGKVTSLLGAVAAGYVAMFRTRTLDQQEKIKRALFKVTQDAAHDSIVADASELHPLGQQLHDTLTGLPNQQFFVSTMEGALGRAGPDSRLTVCKIDLDGLAVINDGFGREIGDQVLRLVAERLQSAVSGEEATVARFGSDEFAILIESAATTLDAAALAAHINSTLAEPVLIDGRGLAVSGCVGVVEHRGGGMTPAALLRAAEAALHDAKNSGQRQWVLFDPHRDADHRLQCRLAATMPDAWANGEISLDYQPLVRLTDDTIIGIHALPRWDIHAVPCGVIHPLPRGDQPRTGPLPRHALPSHECLELAARAGLLVPLGQWMLRVACAQLASWQQRFSEAALLLHVDLTPQQSHDPELVAGVISALEQAGLAAERLQLGIPISALDTEAGEDNLRALAERGVATALLGFSGVHDLAHVEDLPAGTVELAPRVVRRVAQRPGDDSAVAHAVPLMLRLAHRCGAIVNVRGIDTHHDADWWAAAGADVGQGAFLAPPAGPDEIKALLSSHRISPRLRVVD